MGVWMTAEEQDEFYRKNFVEISQEEFWATMRRCSPRVVRWMKGHDDALEEDEPADEPATAQPRVKPHRRTRTTASTK